MRIIRPTYYKYFKCIAGECNFTCCQEWDICVDPKTRKRWKQIGLNVDRYVAGGCGGDYILLNKDRFCPFLTDEGLCSLVLKYGEGIISQTCHTYPREKKQFSDRCELSLAIGCPEALRLLWEQPLFETETVSESSEESVSQQVPSVEAANVSVNDPHDVPDADTLLQNIRDNLCQLMQNSMFTPGEAIKAGFFILLDLKKNRKGLTIQYINEQFKEDILLQLKQAMNRVPEDAYAGMYEQNELFLDLADSYRNKGMYARMLEPLAVLAESLEIEDLKGSFISAREAFEPEWSKLDRKISLLLAEEVFSSLYLPGNDIDEAVIKMEWIGLTYAFLKQGLFLTWLKNRGENCLSRESISNTVVMVDRMTGYSQEDIEEYMKNSFENPVWEWSYMNLII